MKHRIFFKKWIDPLDIKTEEVKEEDNEYYYLENSYEDIANNSIEIDESNLKTQVLVSHNLGVFAINENSVSSKIFNFWVGHTNFSLSSPIVNIIEQTDGVETLDIFTRYRFRIGIGTLFKAGSVFSDIEERVLLCLRK